MLIRYAAGIRTLKRSLFYVAATLSLVMVALWVRSYFASDWVRLNNFSSGTNTWDRASLDLRQFPGALEICCSASAGASGPFTVLSDFETRPFLYEKFGPGWVRHDLDPLWWPRMGFTWDAQRSGQFNEFRVTVPFWALLLASSGVAYAMCGRRHLDQHCVACGYDLRATPDRCPECGTLTCSGQAAA
jgi:hypothetical protein